jgi:cell division septal protein FtsQ
MFALLGLFGIELLAVVLTSSHFAVRQVRLYGEAGLPETEREAVVRAVTLPNTTNFLRVSSGQIEERLRAIPSLRSAVVARRLPNGIEARVQMRVPILIAQIGSQRYEIDTDGVVIRIARPERAQLPLVTLGRERPVEMGTALNDAVLREVLLVLQNNGMDIWQRVAKIEVDQNDILCLNMRDGIKVELGDVGELPKKIALVQRIYHREPNVAQRLVAINLSCPDWPACKLRAETTPGAPDSPVIEPEGFRAPPAGQG